MLLALTGQPWKLRVEQPASAGSTTSGTAAKQSITTDVESILGADPQYSWFLAECYALIDDRAAALAWLERAATLGFINYPLLARRDPLLEPLRAEPAFQQLITKVKLQWESFSV